MFINSLNNNVNVLRSVLVKRRELFEKTFKYNMNTSLDDITNQIYNLYIKNNYNYFKLNTRNKRQFKLFEYILTKQLSKNYVRIQTFFSKQLINDLNIHSSDLNKEVESQLQFFNNQHSQAQSIIILDTLIKKITNTIEVNKTKNIKNDIKLSKKLTTQDSLKKSLNLNKTHSQLISQTETQTVSNKSQDIEKNTINQNMGMLALISNDIKSHEKLVSQWHSVMLPTSRPAHVRGEGQLMGSITPDYFVIGGDLFKYAGDFTHAKIANAIRCYCFNTYVTQTK